MESALPAGKDEVGRAAEGEPRRPKYIIGVDEVGRGSLAGPVTVAVVCIPAGRRIRSFRLGKLRDSKKLAPAKREAWHDYLARHPHIEYRIARVYPRMIEKVNISGAANLAAWRAFRALSRAKGFRAEECEIWLDGGLFLGKKGKVPSARTLAKADETVPAVAIASILAKVSRDRFMQRLGQRYPGYGFGEHKGYATRDHRNAVLKWGPSAVHRLTFLGKYITISKN